jgi:hypothetical protein
MYIVVQYTVNSSSLDNNIYVYRAFSRNLCTLCYLTKKATNTHLI